MSETVTQKHGTYRTYRSGCRCHECRAENTRIKTAQNARKYHRNKERALAALGGSCAQCGSTTDLRFDHIQPSSKAHNVADLFHRSWERVADEIEKCQLLCADCHRAKSSIEGRQLWCSNGHLKLGDNAFFRSDGAVMCRECKNIGQRKRRAVEVWQEVTR